MILEKVVLNVQPKKASKFVEDFKEAGQYISSIEGYIRHQLLKCIETENQYLLLVEWENLTDHTIGFRESEAYQKWKMLLHHYYEPFPTVEHYERVS